MFKVAEKKFQNKIFNLFIYFLKFFNRQLFPDINILL